MKIEIPIHLSDAELAADLKVRAGREREATSHFIAGLAEFDRRRLYLPAGFPQPDVPALIRKLPAPATSVPSSVASPTAGIEASAWKPAPPPDVTQRPVVKPLASDRYQIRFTASAATRDKLVEARDLLRHAVPSGDPAEIIDRALTLLLKELKRKKFAATDRPRRSRGPTPGSRTIAAPVQRGVSKRDDERCAFVSSDGRRCNTRAYVQFHHVDPYGVGGETTLERTELRCRAHNEYEAQLFYGRPWWERGTRPGTSAPSRFSRDAAGRKHPD